MTNVVPVFNRIPPLVRVPLRFGAIGGVLGFVLIIVLYYIGRHPFLIHPVFDFRVALFGILIFFALRELREYHFNGLLSFGKGMIASLVFVLSYGIIASLLIWIFTLNVPVFVRDYIDLYTNQVKSYPQEVIDQIGRENYDRTLVQLKTVTGGALAKLYFIQGMIIGFFISIILSVILRRQPQNP
ncbi:MAG: DUF4199 domain-containing protein [Bacteroidota bacterium]